MPHLLPGDLQRPAGSTDAAEAVRGDAGRGGGEGRSRRARVRNGTAVAGLLRAGGTSRVDGGPVALSRSHRPDTHDRRLDRRRTVEEVLGEASAFRIPNAPITNGANATTWAHFRDRGNVRGQSQGRHVEPRTTLPAGGRKPPGTGGGTPPRRVGERGGGDTGAAGADSCPTAVSLAALRGTADSGHDVVLGRTADGSHVGAPRCGGHPPRIGDPSRRGPSGRRRAADGGSVLGAWPDLRRAQHEQEEPDDRPGRRAGDRSGPPACRDV